MFVLESTYDGAGTVVEKLVTGEAVADGQAVKFTNGAAVGADGTDKPDYIGAQNQPEIGGEVAAVAVREDQVWKTDCAGSQKKGAAYTIASGGEGITTTTENGVATVVSVDADAGKCRVRFK